MESFKFAFTIVFLILFACGDSTKETPSPETQNNANNVNNQNNVNNANNLNNVNNANNENNQNNVYVPDGCVPTDRNFQSVIQPLLERACHQCHGEQPDFGAPNSLIEYDALIAGEPGERLVDKIVTQVGEYQMPPSGSNDVMVHSDRDTLVEWASCGERHPNHSSQLVVSREEHIAPEEPPANTEIVELTAEEFHVPEDATDRYQCFSFRAPNTETKFMVRAEAIIDDSRVLHHMILMGGNRDGLCPNAFDEFFYTWAPGGGAIQFPDGGVRVEPGQRFTVQIHYNNGAAIQDAFDSSGVRLYLADSVENEYRMMTIGPGLPAISVAPGESVTEGDACQVEGNGRMFIGGPHMHEIGTDFEETVVRADRSVDTIVNLTGWAFDSQRFYQYDMELFDGDWINTRCSYTNNTDAQVTGGLQTNDEMCFDFIYVTPPNVRCGDEYPF